MAPLDPILASAAAAGAVGWATIAAARAPGMRGELLLRGLLGGAAAFGLALSAYQLLDGSGVRVAWETFLLGGWPALWAALLVGLVEEGAKLAGLLLATRDASRPGAVVALTVGVSAGFAGLEAVSVLSGAPAGMALGRALLAPVAHAALALPVGVALAWSATHRRPASSAALAAALVLAVLLHGASDLSLASSWPGRLGFAVALTAPVVALFLLLRLRLRPAVARAAGGR